MVGLISSSVKKQYARSNYMTPFYTLITKSKEKFNFQ